MPKNLVIVESPAKAKTIEGYLGKDFLVKSSFGHVRDLPKGNQAIDIQNGYLPTYEISPDKKEVVSQLRKLAKESDTVWLATDDDREGEAISWHLAEALSLDSKTAKRIVFHEITKNAILKAIDEPRVIDLDLVNAQQARRILDRLVGFEMSPILWKKIKPGLSAGRVQSVAVRLIVEREREIEKFSVNGYFKVTAQLISEGKKAFQAELSTRFDTKEEAIAFLESCVGKAISVKSVEKKPSVRKPAAPFTTSTLQQEASRKLGFSVSQTMTVAQRLYESGKITYMRTDSTNLSDTAMQAAAAEISAQFGNNYVETRQYKTKSASAQEAHEAIRPTDFSAHQVDGERNEQRLYELIWKRSIASQMANAQIDRTVASIAIEGNKHTLQATGEVIAFDGFLKVYIESTDDESEEEENKGVLPPLFAGHALTLSRMNATERFTRPPARYTEASLVKELEEKGIGRPSTYAPTISTIQKRDYVLKESREGKERKYADLVLESGKIIENTKKEITGADKAKLFPTDMGMIVTDFLVKSFPTVTDYSFTANIEKEFDEIAGGKLQWQGMIDAFYKVFHARVENTENIERADVGTQRILGTHPESGKTMLVRLAKFGPVVQIGTVEELPEDEKPQFASLKKGQLMDTITIEDALELFKLPRDVGQYENKKVTAAIGRFGPYISHNAQFVSLKEDDPMNITLERAIELIEAKRKADAEKLIKAFEEDPKVQILNGRWGPYLKFGDQNIKIPKDKDPLTLTFADCAALAADAPKGKTGGFKRKGGFSKKK